MIFRTEPRHACETPLIQGNEPGHAWSCICGQAWTVRHRIGEFGGHLTWDKDRTTTTPAWIRNLALRGRHEPAPEAT